MKAIPAVEVVPFHRNKRQSLVVDKPTANFKDACLSAVILALANTGDAFLYVYLPSNYQQAGISLFWVGVILSVNRYTRFFLNGHIAWILSIKGIKPVITIAAVLASLTTVSYGWISAIPLWILARVLWGISFSTLRLGNTLYALDHQRKGVALGMSRALIETGPVIALSMGPWLLQYAGSSFTFFTFGLLSLAGTLLIRPLGVVTTEHVFKKDLVLSIPSSYNILVLLNAFTTEGVLIVLASRLIQHDQLLQLANPLALVGLLLMYRRLSLVFFSPVSGWLADRWGFHNVFIYSMLFSAAGLLIMLFGAPVVGIFVVFTFSAINASTATGGAIGQRNSYIKDVSDNATWRDIGAASGALAGSLLLSVGDLRAVIAGIGILQAIGLLYHRAKRDRNNETQMRLFQPGTVIHMNKLNETNGK